MTAAVLAWAGLFMSVEALTRVFAHSEARLGARLVLLALADCAHDDGTNAYRSVKTLAEKTRMSQRAVQYALRLLERTGEITATGRSKYGTTIYAIRLGGADSAGATNRGSASDDEPGAQAATAGVQPASPNPSVNPSGEPSGSSSAREPTTEEELPRDFPDHLRAVLDDQVLPVLQRVAKVKTSSVAPTRGAAARAIAQYSDRDHLDAATDLEQWLVHGTGRKTAIADVVQNYRRTLSRPRPKAPQSVEPPERRPEPGRYDRVMRR